MSAVSMSASSFDFWFSIGSTYTYLTVKRITDVEREAGLEAVWRPFSVRALMQEMNNVPFVGKPVKERYMWRDFQRRAERLGVSIRVPCPYPLERFDRANRIAVVAAREGWCEDYVRTTYDYWMLEHLPPGDEANLARCLDAIGQAYDRVLRLADSDDVSRDYRAATDQARALGIFGSPSFIVDGSELFWGDDRLEDAVGFWQSRSVPDDRSPVGSG